MNPPPPPPDERPVRPPDCPACFTPQQWADVCDWYWSGRENGWYEGYRAGLEASYRAAAELYLSFLPPEYIPRTPFIETWHISHLRPLAA